MTITTIEELAQYAIDHGVADPRDLLIRSVFYRATGLGRNTRIVCAPGAWLGFEAAIQAVLDDCAESGFCKPREIVFHAASGREIRI